MRAYGPLPKVDVNPKRVFKRLLSDKKTVGGVPHFVLADGDRQGRSGEQRSARDRDRGGEEHLGRNGQRVIVTIEHKPEASNGALSALRLLVRVTKRRRRWPCATCSPRLRRATIC